MPTNYTVTMNARQHAIISTLLTIHISHLEEYRELWDWSAGESEAAVLERINSDIVEHGQLLGMLKNTKQDLE